MLNNVGLTLSFRNVQEIVDIVVEQEEEDKANEIATEMEKKITESKDSRWTARILVVICGAQVEAKVTVVIGYSSSSKSMDFFV